MASVNKVTLIGNVGKDPEIRHTQAGATVASFSLATSESWKDASGKKQEKTEWHSVSVFGKTAEVVRDYVTKGKQLYIEGQLTYREWTDKDEKRHVRAEVKVSGPNSKLVLLGGGRGKEQSGEREIQRGNDAGEFQVDDSDVPF